MFRYVLGFILAVVIITAGIVAIVILYDEETLASRPADAEEAANRGTESKQLAPEPTRATPPASPTPAPTVLPLPTLPPLPKATPYPAGDPELYGAIWRGTSDAESCKLSSMKVERLMPATIRAIRSCTQRSGGPLQRKYRYS